MKLTVMLAVMLAASAWAAECPKHAKDASALSQIEQTWAKALTDHNTEAVACIMAPEYQDADTEGQLHDRATMLARVPQRKPGANVLSELDPHVYGDVGYIRGLATLVDPTGKVVAQVRFTDIFVYRGGRWLAVAGQESLVKEPGK